MWLNTGHRLQIAYGVPSLDILVDTGHASYYHCGVPYTTGPRPRPVFLYSCLGSLAQLVMCAHICLTPQGCGACTVQCALYEQQSFEWSAVEPRLSGPRLTSTSIMWTLITWALFVRYPRSHIGFLGLLYQYSSIIWTLSSLGNALVCMHRGCGE